MHLITALSEIREYSQTRRREGASITLVPTMGALHEGHLSLVRRARHDGGAAVIVSIFVNPIQFGAGEDLSRYPRNLDRDMELLRSLRVDAVFAPTPEAMYPPGADTTVEPGEQAWRLEGAIRPGHFRGVATVVLKLFNLVEPTVAYFGQKDFQQVLIIRRMVEDLNLNVRLSVCPIVREPSGLALSSRNAYLSEEERQRATALRRSLLRAQALFHRGETRASVIVEEMLAVFTGEPGLEVDYAVLADPASLRPAEHAVAGTVALVAARVGPARLIDNLILGPEGLADDDLIRLALEYPKTTSRGPQPMAD